MSKANVFDMMAGDSDKKKTELPSNEKLKELGDLVNKLADLEEKIFNAEEDLKKLNKGYNELSLVRIPDLFDEFGLSKLDLADGTKIEITRKYSASITEKNQTECFTWLRDNEHDGIIKHDITINLKKGEGKEAITITKQLNKLGVTYKDKEHVHPQTLYSFVKDEIEKGTDFPQETFKVFPIRKAKVKHNSF